MTIYDVPNLVRVNGSFSPTEKLREYSMNPDWKDFTSFWAIISGAQEQIGKEAYEKVANFVQDVRDIDYCGLHELYSLATDLNVEHLFSYDLAYPAELDKLMNLLSINRALLTTSGAVLDDPTLNGLFNDSYLSSSFSLTGEFIPSAAISDYPLMMHRRYLNVATVSSSAPHDFTLGQDILVSGFLDTSFNGYSMVGNIVSDREFRYTSTGSDSVWTADGGVVRINRIDSYYGEASQRVIPDDRYVTGFIEPALSAHLIKHAVYPDTGNYNLGTTVEYDADAGTLTFRTTRVSNFSASQKVAIGNVFVLTPAAVSLKGIYDVAWADDFNSFTVRRNLGISSGTKTLAGAIPYTATANYVPETYKNDASDYRGFLDEIYTNPSTEFASDSANIIRESTHTLRNIALRASYQRDTLKNIVKKHAIIGTAKAVEKIIKEYLLRSFTKKGDWRLYTPSGSIVPIPDDQIMEKYVPNLTYGLTKGLRAGVVEYYDNTEYMNVSAASPHSTGIVGYTEVVSTRWDLVTSGGMVSSLISGTTPVYGDLSGYVVTGGNMRYWEGSELSDAILFSESTLAEVSAFYVNAGLSGDYQSMLNFQSELWDLGAASGYNRYAVIPDLSGALTPQYSSYMRPVDYPLIGHGRDSNMATVTADIDTVLSFTLGQDVLITGFLDGTFNGMTNVAQIVSETIFKYHNAGSDSAVAGDDGVARKFHSLSDVPPSGWSTPRTDLSPVQRKYIGTEAGDALPANSKNTIYPSMAFQPFIWNLVEKTTKNYPELLASILYSEHISKAFYSDQVDVSGNLIDSWKYFNREMIGYQSMYEEYTNYDWTEKMNPAVDRDGPFDPNALSAIIDTASPLTSSGVDSLSGRYNHIRRNFNVWKTTPNIADQLMMFKEDMVGLSGYNITQFSQDLYDHQYMLYKRNLTGDVDDPGMMWMRYRNHPLPFPLATNIEELSGSLHGYDYSQLYFGGGFGTHIYEILNGGTHDFGLYDNLLWILGRTPGDYQVASRSRLDGVVNLTFPVTSDFEPGDKITVDGMSDPTYNGFYSMLSGTPSGCPSSIFVSCSGADEASTVELSGVVRHSAQLHLFTNRYVNMSIDPLATKKIVYATFENEDVPAIPVDIGPMRNFIGSYRKDVKYAVFVYAIPLELASDGSRRYVNGWNIKDLNILGDPSQVKFVFEHYDIENKRFEFDHPDRIVVVGTPNELPCEGSVKPPYRPFDTSNKWRLSVSEDIVTIAYESRNRHATYELTVIDGVGDGWYVAGMTTHLAADPPPPTYVFDKWTTTYSPSGALNMDPLDPDTAITMPSSDVEVEAMYASTTKGRLMYHGTPVIYHGDEVYYETR